MFVSQFQRMIIVFKYFTTGKSRVLYEFTPGGLA